MMDGEAIPGGKRMRLRFSGTCSSCGMSVGAGENAVYYRDSKTVRCMACDESTRDAAGSASVSTPDGVAGGSARREYQRRIDQREQRVRTAHPKLGGLILALTDDPQSTVAWQRGARGEEILGRRLDDLAERGVLRLHDRRIRGTRANIDHIASSAAGVFVIDAKRYQGRPELRVTGGIVRPRVETLVVGGRDRTQLVQGAIKQVQLVQSALAAVPDLAAIPVRGMLCFIDADWPLFAAGFATVGIDVLPPAQAVKKITATGPLTTELAARAHTVLAAAFPPA